MIERPRVDIYDCTLREGAQASGIAFSLRDKLAIIQLVDDIGFRYTEGGWPASNAKDEMLFTELKKIPLKHTKVVAFGRTRHAKVKAENDANLNDLIATGMECGHIFGKGWDFQVREVLATSLEENLAAIFESVGYLKKHMGEVSFGFEHFFDAYKGNPAYACKVIEAAVQAGVDWIDLADTNGGCFPDEVGAIVREVHERFDVAFAVHCHDDTGCAVANAIAAVKSGVRIVEGTINGISERCGMCDLCTLIPNLQLKLGYQCIPDANVKDLFELARSVTEILQTPAPERRPYVGSLAFTHKGGVHVDAFMKNPRTYEHIAPALVGNSSNVVVSEVAGKKNLDFFFRKHDLEGLLDDVAVKRLLGTIKALELSGFDFNAVEEALLVLVLREANRLTHNLHLKEATMGFRNEPRVKGTSTVRERRTRPSIETCAIDVSAKIGFRGPEGDEADEDIAFVVEDDETSFSWVVDRFAEHLGKRFPVLATARFVDY